MIFQPHKYITPAIIPTERGDIKSVSCIKFLGMHVDDKLSWKSHILEINKKLSSAVFAIMSIRKNVGFQAAKTVYFAYFYSILQYGVEFWGNLPASQSTFLIQKKAIRALCCLSRLESCKQYFKDLGLFTLTDLYIYRISLIVYNNKHSLTTSSDIHAHYTRFNYTYRTPHYNFNVNRNGPAYMGIRVFNHLPLLLQRATNIKTFKLQLKNLLLLHNFYDLDNFFHCTL